MLTVVCLQCIKAQGQTNMQKYAKTESTHIIDIGLINAGYTYEYAFAPKFTLNFGAGIAGSIGYASSNLSDSQWFYSFHPYLSIEPRYYYNLQKRLNKNKKIDGNCGSFFAIQSGYVLKPFVQKNIYYDKALGGISPYWGLRRIWGEHFLFEFHAGLAIGFNNYSDSDIGINLGLRFGYMF